MLRRRWHVITLATLAGHLSVFAVLLVSLRVLDVPASEVTWIEAFAAWSVMRVLGSLPITPGGLGIVELGLTSLLVGFGGGQAEVVAAVLVYRFLTIVPTLVLGMARGGHLAPPPAGRGRELGRRETRSRQTTGARCRHGRWPRAHAGRRAPRALAARSSA